MRRRRMNKHGLPHRLTAILLCLCMVTSIVSGIGVKTAYADNSVSGEATEHVTNRVADPDTMDDYQNRLLTDTSGSRYAGRVWTDKTVFAYGDSARGGVKAATLTGTTQSSWTWQPTAITAAWTSTLTLLMYFRLWRVRRW